MKSVHFNCKLEQAEKKETMCSCSDLLSSLSSFFLSTFIIFRIFFKLQSISQESFFLFPPLPACFFSVFMTLKLFLKCILFIFCFVVGVMTPLLHICLPFISLPPSLLIISLFSLFILLFPLPLSLFLSQAPCENLRTPSSYPGNMLPHHPGQGNFEDFTCWADPGEASKWVLCNQSQPYNKTI